MEDSSCTGVQSALRQILGGGGGDVQIPMALRGTAAFSLHMAGCLDSKPVLWEAAEQVG